VTTARGNGDARTNRPPVVPAGGRFEGRLAFRGEAGIDGEVVGPVEGIGRLEIGASGRVVGPVSVDELVSHGAIEGDVEASDRARLEAGATLRGTLSAPRLAVANGAVIQGRCSVGGASE
jgi:cytoskeletal protein CcmA (bactofilin family)